MYEVRSRGPWTLWITRQSSIVTSDEIWVYDYDVVTKAQSSRWKSRSFQRPTKARQSLFWEFLPQRLLFLLNFDALVHDFCPKNVTVVVRNPRIHPIWPPSTLFFIPQAQVPLRRRNFYMLPAGWVVTFLHEFIKNQSMNFLIRSRTSRWKSENMNNSWVLFLKKMPGGHSRHVSPDRYCPDIQETPHQQQQ